MIRYHFAREKEMCLIYVYEILTPAECRLILALIAKTLKFGWNTGYSIMLMIDENIVREVLAVLRQTDKNKILGCLMIVETQKMSLYYK